MAMVLTEAKELVNEDGNWEVMAAAVTVAFIPVDVMYPVAVPVVGRAASNRPAPGPTPGPDGP